MKDKIKSICLSKTNILAVSFSTFAFLNDLQELITNFASHLILVGLAIIVLIILLSINLILSNRKVNNTENAVSVKINKSNEHGNSSNRHISHKTSTSIFNKIIFSSVLFFTLMTLGSLYYVKNMGVYYVVLKNNLTLEEAKYLKEKTNSSTEFVEHKLSTRILEVGGGKHELVLFNGYIIEQKANSDFELVMSMRLGFEPYKLGPQHVANYFKKIRYLQNDIFN